MREKENNFTEGTCLKLKMRAGNVCSKPDCRTPTSGAKAGDDEGVLNMGVAAHVCAASPGGARYEKDMTTAQRSSYRNGIWLCIPCSNIIDKDELVYPIDLLQEWKRTAEKRSQDKIGKPPLPDSAPRDLVATVLHGAPLKSGIAQAIANAHGGVERALEMIDDRFRVSTMYADGLTTFNISARERVPLSLVLKNPKAYAHAYQLLVDEGKTLTLKAEDFEASGSALFEQITAEAQELHIGNSGRPLTAKISTHDPVTGRISTFDDIQGEYVFGRLRGTLTGYSMNNLLKVVVSMAVAQDGDLSIALTPMMEKWNGVPVTELPYYTKMCSLISNLNEGHTLNLTLEHMGELALSGSTEGSPFKGQYNNAESLLLYAEAARTISNFTGKMIRFDETKTIHGDEIDKLMEIASMTRGEFVRGESEVHWPVTFQVAPENEAKKLKALALAEHQLDLQVVQYVGDVIHVFGQEFQMPPRTTKLFGVTQSVMEIPSDSSVTNLQGKIFPEKNFRMEITYSASTNEKQ